MAAARPLRLDDCLPFSVALHVLHAGMRIAREGWDGKGQWVALHVNSADDRMDRPFIYINPVDGMRVPWVASQTDILADDWCVLTPAVPDIVLAA